MASSLIPASKLSEDQIKNLIWGFACGGPKTDIAGQAGMSEKAVVSLILKLRERLSRPPFYIWNAPSDVFVLYDWPEVHSAADQAVFGVIAACYFDKRCLSNYRQGRRKSRFCRHCMIEALFDDKESAARTVAFIDVIHAFYQHLGIGGERGRVPTDVLMDRWKHTLIMQRAREHSTLQNDVPAFDDAGERSCRALYEKMIADLAEEPLIR